MLIYLFGLPAAGKNYVGRVLADAFGLIFYDGDLDLTPEMRAAVREERPFTEAMRDDYYAALINRIGRLLEDHADLAFGQATFKERHRRLIARAFPEVIFVLVEASEAARMARLTQGGNPVSVEYARQIAGFFEPPQHPHYVIVNEGSRDEVIRQLTALLASLPGSYD